MRTYVYCEYCNYIVHTFIHIYIYICINMVIMSRRAACEIRMFVFEFVLCKDERGKNY